MAMKMEKVVAVPPGTHDGIIIRAEETTKVFNHAEGPEPTVEIEIQPSFKKDGYRTLPVAVVFSPVLTSVSALGKLLGRLNVNLEQDQEFNVRDLEGREITFDCEAKRDGSGFIVVKKDSIRAKK
jgi:hypothetical protein